MTGSIHRQLSSTAPSKPADDQSLVVEENQSKEMFAFKRVHNRSENDSGTEEIDQQMEQLLGAHMTTCDDQSSIQSASPIPDEGFSECEREEETRLTRIMQDLELAKCVADEVKKDFCQDTVVAFHGEFARLISVPLSLNYDVRYYLFAEEDLEYPYLQTLPFPYIKLDNAKAQFKCPYCKKAWTSMRARIAFNITDPQLGHIVLKILGQNCKACGTHADALWYIDEVCRVMKNLAQFLFEKYFPDMLNQVDLTIEKPNEHMAKPNRHRNHDPTQRKGKMYAAHVKEFCEACRRGICFS